MVNKVDIVILTKNNLEDTKECLQYIYNNNAEDIFNLIIVDQCSTDGTQNFLVYFAKKYNNINISMEKENLGFAGGCNKGATLGRSEYILFLNNDALLGKDSLKRMLTALKEGNMDAVGPISNQTGEIQKLCEPYNALNYHEEMERVGRKLWLQYGGKTALFHRLAGFCLLVKRKAFESIKGFSLEYGIGYYEDDDLCYRLHKNGYKLAVACGVFVHHHGSRSFKKAKISSDQLIVRNRLRFLENTYYRDFIEQKLDNEPLVSVLISTKDRPKQLMIAIDSVLKQGYSNIELIIVRDGGCSVSETISEFDDTRIKLINLEENIGKSSALNMALDKAKGKYIAYLDDDDFYLPNHLKILVLALEKTSMDFAYSDSEAKIIKLNGETVSNYLIGNEFDLTRIEFSNFIPNLAVMHRNKVIYRFDPELKTIEDWDFLRRAAMETGAEFIHVPIVTNVFYYREDNSTRNGARFKNPALYFENHSRIETRSIWWLSERQSSEAFRCDIKSDDNIDLALKKLRQAVALNQWNVLAQLTLAKLLISMGELDQAKYVLETFVVESPSNYEHIKLLIYLSVTNADYQRVIELCSCGLLFAPTSSDLVDLYRTMSKAYKYINIVTATLCYSKSVWLSEICNYDNEIQRINESSIMKLKRKYKSDGIKGVCKSIVKKIFMRIV